jgi:hypothetical protein
VRVRHGVGGQARQSDAIAFEEPQKDGKEEIVALFANFSFYFDFRQSILSTSLCQRK